MLLNAFYDSVNKVGPTICWVFMFLMAIELLYVSAKYLNQDDAK
jgi:hypothetical protein